ncbi:MAG: enoyl-CoA hydratase/isomerase family protein [Flavobacteriales bacterium]
MFDSALQEGVSCTVDDRGVAVVTFAHPRSNSLPGAVLADLAETIRGLGDRADVRVVVLGSAGDRAFCAGASFDELVAISDEAEGLRFFMGFANVINAMRSIPQLIIGRVQGKAVGGGVGLASAVDYCLATKHAAVKLSELAVGIGPFVVGPAVERKLGVSAMSQLAIDATEWRPAAWAEAHGLYASVHEDAAALDAAVDALAGRLAGSNPEAMAEMKRTFWRGTDDWDALLAERAAISGRLVLSDFTREAIARFKAG